MAHGIGQFDHMVSVRQVPWHGLGTVLEEAVGSEATMEAARLNWLVSQHDVEVGGFVVPGYKANVRSDTGMVLSIATDSYTPIQNSALFDIGDAILSNADAVYETAGSLFDGRNVWCLAKFPDMKIAGDDFNDYLLISTGHDASTPLRVSSTPIRVVCNNTLQLALSQASRSWTIQHTRSADERIKVAKESIASHAYYMGRLEEVADFLANKKVSDDTIELWIKELFPIVPMVATDRIIVNIEKLRKSVETNYLKDDIKKFRGTPWGFLQAVSDHAWHAAPFRMTANYAENKMLKLIDGNQVFDRAYGIVKSRFEVPA